MIRKLCLETNYGLDQIEEIAKKIIENVTTKTLILYGNMGVGKTTLIKHIVKELGSKDEVSSPTFSIVNEYRAQDETIYHFDLYRINDIEEVYDFGIEDYLYSKDLCIIEWPEKIQGLLPEQFDRIDLEINPDLSRTIKLELVKNLT